MVDSQIISTQDILLRMLVALVLGAVIGIERERDSQAAGLRTHMILVMGSCLAMILSVNISALRGSDPTRLAAQVISGIGFLGAGAILRFGFNIKGLTTASSLWSMAIVGLAVGYGYYIEGVAATFLMLVTLTLVNLVENRFIRNRIVRNIVIEVNDHPGIVRAIRKVIEDNSETRLTFSVQRNLKSKRLRMEIVAKVNRGEKMENLLENLSAVDGVRAIKIE